MEIIHHHFTSLPSTNDWAKAHLSSFDHNKLTLVTADMQTAARGQYGRSWISFPHLNLNLTFSFFVQELEEPYTLTHLLALSTIRALEDLPCKIKWPNDLIVRNRKLAGILCETIALPSLQGIVLGMGLNVNMLAEQLATINQPATSLLEETGRSYDLPTLLQKLTTQFLADLALFLEKGFTPFEPMLGHYLL